jgi:hypothetical protein
MGFIVSDKGGGKEFPPCPQGLHPARCYYVYHLGLQPDNFKGVPRWVEKCMIGFEFPTHKLVFDEKEGPMPYTLGMPFTASLGEKSNLRKTLVAWRGRPFSEAELKAFDISKVVGAPALVQVIHEQKLKDGKTKAFAKIANVLPLPPEMKALLPPAIQDHRRTGNSRTNVNRSTVIATGRRCSVLTLQPSIVNSKSK